MMKAIIPSLVFIVLLVVTLMLGVTTSSLQLLKRGNQSQQESRTFTRRRDVVIFVHGAWHTKDIWNTTMSKIRREYNVEDVTAVQLPGRSYRMNTCAAPIPPQSYGVLAGYYASFNLTSIVDELTSVIAAKRNLGRIHIVAHSLSGAYVQHTLSVMDPALRSSIETVVFVASYLTAPGKSVLEYTNNSTLLLENLTRPWPTAPMLCVNTTEVAKIFYNTCRPSLKTAAVQNLVYEPVIPIVTPLSNTLKDLDIKQVYIKTLLDRAIPPSSQTAMISEQRQLGNNRLSVVDLWTDHTPQYCSTSYFVPVLGAILNLRLSF
jgi:pimeloyl-ACP methyl ester carboxylesterase